MYSKEDMDKMIEQYMNIVYSILNKRFSQNKNDDDFIQAGRIGLWKAIEKFDPMFGYKFETFAWKCVYNSILNEFKKNQRQLMALEKLSNIYTEKQKDDIEDWISEKDFFIKISKLNKSEIILFNMIKEGLSRKEISLKLGISEKALSMRIARIKGKIKGE